MPTCFDIPQTVILQKSACDKSQDFLSESDNNTARKGKKTVGTLRGVVALKGQTNLNNTPTKQDNADCTNKTKRARPIACIAPLMFTMTDQMPPPLKLCGVVVSSVHIS